MQLSKTKAELDKATRELALWKTKVDRLKSHSNPYLFEDSHKFDLLESKQYAPDANGKKGAVCVDSNPRSSTRTIPTAGHSEGADIVFASRFAKGPPTARAAKPAHF